MVINVNKNGLVAIWNFFKGKKTYLVSLGAVVYGWGIQQGLWHHDARIDYLLLGGGFATIRHGISSETEGTTTVVMAPPITGNSPINPPKIVG